MDTNNDFGMGIQFDMPKNNPSIIKVIGVGGGGGNAVNHMFREGIHDVSYVVCNTDQKALEESPVPTRVQLGDGLGAGNKPEVGREKAIESIEQIKQMFTDGTRMVFVTAGMGGGTGTGAAPIIAQCAKDMDILTVGIVTIPFLFEGKMKIFQALEGVQEISKHVDALLVINNERLREIYQDWTSKTSPPCLKTAAWPSCPPVSARAAAVSPKPLRRRSTLRCSTTTISTTPRRCSSTSTSPATTARTA